MMKNSIVKKIICLVFVVNVAWTAFSLEDDLLGIANDSLTMPPPSSADDSLAIGKFLDTIDNLLAKNGESLDVIDNESSATMNGGWVLGLRADFFGALTMPSISEATLKYMNPLADDMTGTLSSLLMGGELELGYIFNRLAKDVAFSGIGVSVYLGMGQGNASQKISAVQVNTDGTSVPFDIFMIVDYLPVVNFGIKGEVLFFDNRFSVGLGVGGKAILDMSPSYLVYSTEPEVIATEIGEIIVTEEMMKKMNPLALSLRFEMSYAVPVLPTTNFVIGWFTAYNFYSPKYLTLPPSLEKTAQDNATPTGSLDFSQPFPDYWINSLEFGVNIGLVFKL